VTRGVGHFDGAVMWSVAASVLDSFPVRVRLRSLIIREQLRIQLASVLDSYYMA